MNRQDQGEGVDADPDTPDPSQGEEPKAGSALERPIAPSIEVVGRGRRRHYHDHGRSHVAEALRCFGVGEDVAVPGPHAGLVERERTV